MTICYEKQEDKGTGREREREREGRSVFGCCVCAKASQVGIDSSGQKRKQGLVKKRKKKKREGRKREEGRRRKKCKPFLCAADMQGLEKERWTNDRASGKSMDRAQGRGRVTRFTRLQMNRSKTPQTYGEIQKRALLLSRIGAFALSI
jgi:hypothetical protein